MNQRTNWRKRLLRTGSMAVVVPILFSSGYAGMLLASRWAVNHGLLTDRVPASRVFAPLKRYEASNLPGGPEFETLSLWLNADGRVPWDMIALNVAKRHRGEIQPECHI